MQLEQSIQRAILEYLRWHGIPCYKHQNAGIRKPDGSYIPSHTRGVSDIIGCIPKTGRFLAIEVKRPGGKPTPEQQQFIDMINEAGGLAFVASSLEELHLENFMPLLLAPQQIFLQAAQPRVDGTWRDAARPKFHNLLKESRLRWLW